MIALLFLLAACTTDSVENAIEDANYCETVDECVDIGSYCPFGCTILVNEAEADRIERKIEAWDAVHPGQCMYDCVAISGYDCAEGKCVTIEGDTGI